MLTNEERFALFLEKAKETHKGENLDYSKVAYKGMHEKVCIICNELDKNGKPYGEFWQEVNSHLRGHSHPQLAIDRNADRCRSNTEEFIEKCKKVHADKNYDYSKGMI